MTLIMDLSATIQAVSVSKRRHVQKRSVPEKRSDQERNDVPINKEEYA